MAYRFLKKCAKIAGKISLMAEVISAGSIGLLLILVVGDAVAASVFRKPLIWSSDFQSLFLAYALLMPAAYVLHQDSHIRVRVLADRLPPAVQRSVEFLTMVASLVAFIALTVKAWQSAVSSYTRGWVSHTPFGMPLWWSQLAVVVASGLLCLQLLAWLCRFFFPKQSKGSNPSSVSDVVMISSDGQEGSS